MGDNSVPPSGSATSSTSVTAVSDVGTMCSDGTGAKADAVAIALIVNIIENFIVYVVCSVVYCCGCGDETTVCMIWSDVCSR